MKKIGILFALLGISLCACQKIALDDNSVSTEMESEISQESVPLETDVSDTETGESVSKEDEPIETDTTGNVTVSPDSIPEEEVEKIIEKYNDFSVMENAKRMALIYFDEDSIPELLLLKDGEYGLYSYDGSEMTQIIPKEKEITANAYGSRHDFEYPDGLTFYWFEYVPYRGLLRVHGSNEEERYDHYLKYADGIWITELTAKSRDYNWYTYDGEKEISNEDFTSQLVNLGYEQLIPCAYLYEDVMTAYENMERTSDTQQVWKDFVDGKVDAVYSVEEISDIPEDGFLMRSFDDLYEDITAGEEWWGNVEYVDYDSDGEEELVLHGYTGARMFFDVVGDTVYVLLETGSTTDVASVAEIYGKRVIARTDLTHGGRQYYQIMEYDSCGCLTDRYRLYATYEGVRYSREDEFWYRNEEISMEEFEAIVDSIQRIEGEIQQID